VRTRVLVSFARGRNSRSMDDEKGVQVIIEWKHAANDRIADDHFTGQYTP